MRRRKERQKAKVEDDDYSENEKRISSSVLVSSSDDEEANEDLTLKIEEKAQRMREVKLIQNGGVFDGDGGLKSPEVKSTRKKKKVKKGESGDQSDIVAKEQETSEAIKASETNESAEASTVQMSDNIVLRKLLRGPRYFDPPDSSWGTCYNCGEGGHTAVNCKAAKRKKPCFVCGSLEHPAKKCTKQRDCFICKKGGHQAKDCPEKTTGGSRSSTLCLKCGNSGHDMFSCKNSYSSDDLKEIQCYVCKAFGHLCCVNSDDGTKREVSCYKCGQLGHTGLACSRVRGDTTGAATHSTCFKCGEEGHFARECTSIAKVLVEESSGAATASSCYKCGEEGHFARECTSSAKVRKRNRQLSRSSRSHKEKDYMEYGSAPPVMGKAYKRKKIRNEDLVVSTPRKSKHRGDWMNEDLGEFSSRFKQRGVTTPKKSKRRGGWITEDSEELYPRKFNNRWMSPATAPRRKSYNHAGSSRSQGLANPYQHRFSVSRFGSSSNNPTRYDWW